MSTSSKAVADVWDGGATAGGTRDGPGRPLIIRLIIQTILLCPSGAVWTDRPSNVSSLDPSGAYRVDAEHPSRNRKVVGSNPTSGSICAGRRLLSKASRLGWNRRWQP